MKTTDEVAFHVGDSDLRFLGLAAALAARYEMKRKGGNVFASSDTDAIAKVQAGIAEGASLPLDDIPDDIHITVYVPRATFERMRAIAPADTVRSDPDDDGDDGWSAIPDILEP